MVRDCFVLLSYWPLFSFPFLPDTIKHTVPKTNWNVAQHGMGGIKRSALSLCNRRGNGTECIQVANSDIQQQDSNRMSSTIIFDIDIVLHFSVLPSILFYIIYKH